MKYSVIMPYTHMPMALNNTLIAYWHHGAARPDWEIILVEAPASREESFCHRQLRKVVDNWQDKINIIVQSGVQSTMQGMYNEGVDGSNSELIILTSPEIFPLTSPFGAFDLPMYLQPSPYVIAACVAGWMPRCVAYESFFGFSPEKWLQHSAIYNCGYHYLACISRNNYNRVRYDRLEPQKQFIDQVAASKPPIPVFPFDHILALYQNHKTF